MYWSAWWTVFSILTLFETYVRRLLGDSIVLPIRLHFYWKCWRFIFLICRLTLCPC